MYVCMYVCMYKSIFVNLYISIYSKQYSKVVTRSKSARFAKRCAYMSVVTHIFEAVK